MIFVVGSPSGMSKAERNRVVLKQKYSRNNRNREETAENGFVVVVLVVFVVFAVVVINRSSIGFGIGIGIGRQLEAVEAPFFFSSFPVTTELRL